MTRKSLKHFDWTLLLCTMALLVIGVFVIHSAAANQNIDYAHKQMLWIAIGVPVFLTAVLLPPSFWFATAWLGYGGTLLLLLAVKLMGVVGMGAERWIQLGPLRFQPSELAKITLVLALARFLSDNRLDLKNFPAILSAGLIAATPVVLVLLQPDLGTALVFLFLLYPMLIRAGLPWSWALFLIAPIIAAILSGNIFLLLAFVLILGAVLWFAEVGLLLNFGILGVSAGVGFSLPFLWATLKPYQQQRILTFLNPEADALGAGYQIIQSKVAVGSGGFLGKGFMQGSQTQLAFLPERHTDFIFSVLGEEWGFVGAALVLILFGIIILRALIVGLGHRSGFCALAMTGLSALIFIHVLVNAGMTMGIMPVTGLPMPFLSYGGSFTLSNMLLMGLLINFSLHRRDSLT